MVLPLLLGLLGGGLANAGALGVLGTLGTNALAMGAIGSGIGSAIETGDLGEGLKTGLLSFLGGSILGKGTDLLKNGTSSTALNAASAGGVDPTPAANLPASAGIAPPPRPLPGAVPAAPAGIKGIIGNSMDFGKSMTGMGVGLGATLAPMIGGDLFGAFLAPDNGSARRIEFKTETFRPVLPSLRNLR